MTPKQFKNLDVGDAVVHVTNNQPYIVTGNYGDRVTAVSTKDLTNPDEWELVRKVKTDADTTI